MDSSASGQRVDAAGGFFCRIMPATLFESFPLPDPKLSLPEHAILSPDSARSTVEGLWKQYQPPLAHKYELLYSNPHSLTQARMPSPVESKISFFLPH